MNGQKSFISLEWLDCLPSLVEERIQLTHLKINPESSLCPLISSPYLLPLLFWRKSWSGLAHHHIAALPANPVVFLLPGEHLQSTKGDMGVQRAEKGWRDCLYFDVTLIQLLDAFNKRMKASLMSIRANTDWGVSACWKHAKYSVITPRDHLRLFTVDKTDTERCKVIWPGHAGSENRGLELETWSDTTAEALTTLLYCWLWWSSILQWDSVEGNGKVTIVIIAIVWLLIWTCNADLNDNDFLFVVWS